MAEAPGGGAEGGAGPTPSGGSSPFDVLLRVQELDTALAQLRHRKATLAERAVLREAADKLEQLSSGIAETAARRQDLVDQQGDLERRIAELDARRRNIEERMYGARGLAARDLQAMDEEVRNLSEQRDRLEEQELVLMEEEDPLGSALAELRVEQEQLEVAVEEHRAALAAAEAAVDAETSTLEMARGVEAAKLPADLTSRYENLRARLGGTGAARLVGNRCEGCHLELPAMEVERIRRLPPDSLVTCEQCGRILVRPPTTPRSTSGD